MFNCANCGHSERYHGEKSCHVWDAFRTEYGEPNTGKCNCPGFKIKLTNAGDVPPIPGQGMKL